ncbi:MAG TPA: methionine adenosyltransferase [Candidatus Limnocylindria bacterium]|jgi:S-adenosylmethionine synthetase|nr:methionine adenosyltransferase [Candidatus Limnocylindria bacterium]
MADPRRVPFTSESVTEGHPDKLCDAVADAVLDDVLSRDASARAAIEVAATTGLVLVIGELSTEAYCDVQSVVRRTVREVGYTDSSLGFDWETCGTLVAIKEQSPDIALGVDHALESKEGREPDEIGAGDQGMMFGYASDETPELMPMPIQLAHQVARRLADVRKDGTLPFLRPDGKTQVTVEYGADGRPERVATVVVSTQHDPDVSSDALTEAVRDVVIRGAIPGELLDARTRFLVNPTGRFVVGGPMGDSGLSGRKIIVDTYGGMARHGGGSFSGKDPTKVDRSGAYMTRYVAKNVVAAGLAARCEVQLAYAIGVARPLAVNVETFGTGRIPDERIARLVEEHFDLRPGPIIETLGLRAPIYRQTAAYGHFGRSDLDLPWERTDRAPALRDASGVRGEASLPA